MEIGTVRGAVWATRKAGSLGGCALLVVDTAQGIRVAADELGAGIGDRVLLTFGSAARLNMTDAPVDTSVVAILDDRGCNDVGP
ncbi:MAG: ethanolamine utilization protein EutN [Ruminococcaceae bacterium]|nr:ethanolamine utilization protein EutN [Oscillospiraceae bacterium]